MGKGKGYLAIFKGKKVIFKIVNCGEDLRVQFVDHFGDYKVKISDSRSFAKEIIKVRIVTSNPDVKLERTSSFGDLEVYID